MRISCYSGVLFFLVSVISANADEHKNKHQVNTEVIEEIKVVAKKISGPNIDVKQAVTSYDQEAINAIQPSSVFDVLKTVPGIELGGGPRSNGINLNVRGFSDQEDVLVIVDGALKNFQKYRFGSAMIEPELLKEIEVSRGPSSVIQGSGAIGGVVEMYTKDASDFLDNDKVWGGFVKLGYNTNNQDKLRIASVYGIPVGNLEVLASKTKRGSDNIKLSNQERLPLSKTSPESSLVKLAWLDELWQAGFAFSETKTQGREFFDTASFSGGVNGEVLRSTDDNTWSSYVNFNPETSWVNINASLAYTDTLIFEKEIDTNTQQLTSRVWDFEYDIWNLRVNNNSQYEVGGHHFSLDTGLQLKREERFTRLTTRTGEVSDSVLSQPSGININSAIYSQLQWGWHDLDVTVGYRWDSDETKLTEPEGIEILQNFGQTYKLSQSKGLWNYRFDYQLLGSDWSLFHSYVEAVRYPKIDEYFINGAFSRCFSNQSKGEKLKAALLSKETEAQRAIITAELDSERKIAEAISGIELRKNLQLNNIQDAGRHKDAVLNIYNIYASEINKYKQSINNDSNLTASQKTKRLNQADQWLLGAASSRDASLADIEAVKQGNFVSWQNEIEAYQIFINNENTRLNDYKQQQNNAVDNEFIAAGFQGRVDLSKIIVPSATKLPAPHHQSQVCGSLYKPEMAKNKELGLIFKPENLLYKDDDFSLKINFFETQVNNVLESINSSPAAPASQPGKELKKGVELELSYWLDQWRFDFSYNRIRAWKSNFQEIIHPNPSNELERYMLQFQRYKDYSAPADRYNASLKWINNGENLQLGLDVSYKNSRIAYQVNDTGRGYSLKKQGSITEFNLMGRWQRKDTQVINLTVNNIFNEQYRVPNGFDSGSNIIYLGNFNTGRAIKLSLTQYF